MPTSSSLTRSPASPARDDRTSASRVGNHAPPLCGSWPRGTRWPDLAPPPAPRRTSPTTPAQSRLTLASCHGLPVCGALTQCATRPPRFGYELAMRQDARTPEPRDAVSAGRRQPSRATIWLGEIVAVHAMTLRRQGSISSHPLERVELPDPEPGRSEIRVRVRACAICRTDLHVIEGDLPPRRLPLVPGHQAVGIVDRVGPGCRRFHPGDRVGIAWLRGTCGACGFCRAGAENLCEASRYTGYDEDGGYAELAVVPEAFAYPIPAGFSDLEAAPLLCAGIIGYRALRRTELTRRRPARTVRFRLLRPRGHPDRQAPWHRGLRGDPERPPPRPRMPARGCVGRRCYRGDAGPPRRRHSVRPGRGDRTARAPSSAEWRRRGAGRAST